MNKDGKIRFAGKVAETYAHIVAQRRSRVKRTVALTLASVMLLLTVMNGMQYRGLSLENVTYCGLEEHIHSDECMQTQLICGEEERPAAYTLACPVTVHRHTAACYSGENTLICGQADAVVHQHTALCYDDTGALVCTLPARDAHVHNSGCYKTVKVLTCTAAKAEGHTHTDSCYRTIPGELICTLEENPGHVHTDECYSGGGLIAVCGQNETPGHVHTDSCITYVRDALICGLAEGKADSQPNEEGETQPAHQHTDACYSFRKEYTCGKAEGEGGHTHTADCFVQEEKTLICTIAAGEGGHQHTAECYTPDTRELVCTLTQEAAHVHTDGCYETTTVAICGLPEMHTHTAGCYPGGDTTQSPICGLLELKEHTHDESCLILTDPGHTHTAECYAQVRVCGLTEHIHQESCYVPPVGTEPTSENSAATTEPTAENPAATGDTTEPTAEILTESKVMTGYASGGELLPATFSYTPGAGETTISDSDKTGSASIADYLTGLTVKPADDIKDGAQVNLSMDFDVPGGTLYDGNQTAKYQLPAAVYIPGTMSGYIKSNGENVGVYEITPSGEIYLKFYNDFLNDPTSSTNHQVNLQFEAKFEIEDSKEQEEVTFTGTGDGQTVTVHGVGTYYDVSVEKSASDISTDGTINYTVAVTTEKGTGANLNITDTKTGGVGTYDLNSIVVKDSSGNVLTKDTDYTIDYNEYNPGQFTVSYPAGLAAEESLSISYAVTGIAVPEGSTSVTAGNTATASSPKTSSQPSSTSKTLWSGTPSADKQGEVQYGEDGRPASVQWRFTITSNGANLNGKSFSDTMLQNGDTLTMTKPDGTTETVTYPYTFGDTPTNESVTYTFTYTTPVDPSTLDPYEEKAVTNEVTFDEEKTSATVYVKGKSPVVEKAGSLGEDDQIHWTITIQRNDADLSDATLNDFFVDGESATPLPDGTSATLTGADGTTTTVTFPLDFSTLPEGLQNQDSYTITYTTPAPDVPANATATVTNKVELDDDDHETTKEVGVGLIGPYMEKTGSYSEDTGKITWTIKVYRGTADLTGATLSDPSIPEGTEAKVTINGVEETVTFPVDLGALYQRSQQREYIFTFTQDATPGNTYTNEAIFRYKDVDYPDDDTVTVEEREEELTKTRDIYYVDENHKNDENPYVRPKWIVEAVPENGNLTTLTISDTIVDPEGQSDIHYGNGKELAENLEGMRVTIPGAGEKSLSEAVAANLLNYSIVFYDANGTAVASSFAEARNLSEDVHIKSFSITFSPADGQTTFRLNKVRMEYFTRCYISGQEDTWSYVNQAAMNSKTAQDSYGATPGSSGDDTKHRDLLKAVYSYGMYYADAEDLNVEYVNGTKNVQYGIFFVHDITDKDPVTLTDILPAGMEYVEGSAKWGWANALPPNYGYTHDGDSSKVTASYDPATRQLTLTVSGYNDNGQNTYPIVVSYQAAVTEWPDPFQLDALFTNAVTWTAADLTDSLTVKLHDENPDGRADKTGDPHIDEGVGTIDYTVIVNPKGGDISPDSDKAVLTDTLTLTATEATTIYKLEDIRISLLMESVKLYEYDPDAEDGKGTLISPSRYSLTYDDATRTLTLTFPDELPCLLEYSYSINRSKYLAEFAVDNTLNFGSMTGSESHLVLQHENSMATVNRSQLTLNKVDAENNAVSLAGAVFQIDRWVITNTDTGEGYWTHLYMDGNTTGQYTTDENGKIVVDVSYDQDLKNDDQIIRMTEITPPTNYTWVSEDTKVTYAVLSSSMESFDDNLKADNYLLKKAIIKALGLGDGASDADIKGSVTYVDDAVSMFIPNKNTIVEVEKLWLDSENHLIANPPAAQVQLKKATSEKAPNVDITIRYRVLDNGNWSYTELGTMSEAQIGTTASIHLTGAGDWSYQFGESGTEQGIATLNYYPGIDVSFTVTADTTDVIFTQITPYASMYYSAEGSTYTKAQPQFGIFVNYGDPVTLDSSNNYTYKWENLEPDGVYSVVEVGTPAGYSVTYENNNGIVSGKIIVTNKSEHKEEPGTPSLPETGGIGTYWFTVGGGALMAVALVILVLLRRKRKRHPDE